MSHDTEALVATLQLLLGDRNREDLTDVLHNAFWPKVRILGPRSTSMLRQALGQIENAAASVENHAKSPPLGLLGCEQVRQSMEEIRGDVRRTNMILSNPER